MRLDELLMNLRNEKGAKRVEVMPDDLCMRIVEEESTVSAVNGTMSVRNVGLDDLMARNTKVVVFEEYEFYTSDATTMRMVDSRGNLIGHDIPLSDAPSYRCRDDVTFLSDDFVMYTDVCVEGEPCMEMLPIPYRGTGEWIPAEAKAVMWFASTTSDDIIHKYFSEPASDLATAMIGLDL